MNDGFPSTRKINILTFQKGKEYLNMGCGYCHANLKLAEKIGKPRLIVDVQGTDILGVEAPPQRILDRIRIKK